MNYALGLRPYQNPWLRPLSPALKTIRLRTPESRTDAVPELIDFSTATGEAMILRSKWLFIWIDTPHS